MPMAALSYGRSYFTMRLFAALLPPQSNSGPMHSLAFVSTERHGLPALSYCSLICATLRNGVSRSGSPAVRVFIREFTLPSVSEPGVIYFFDHRPADALALVQDRWEVDKAHRYHARLSEPKTQGNVKWEQI